MKSDENFYVMDGDQTVGPFSLENLEQRLESGELQPEILCAADSMTEWVPLGQMVIDPSKWLKSQAAPQRSFPSVMSRTTPLIPPILGATLIKCPDCGKDVSRRAASCPHCGAPISGQPVSAPPVHQTVHQVMAIPQRYPKSRLAYVVLALLVGGLGIHNFYAGYVGRGLVQLAVLLTMGWLIVPVVVLWVVAIIEACTVDADAYGVPML
jgi:TM2 domain-containing membrane protein YozV